MFSHDAAHLFALVLLYMTYDAENIFGFVNCHETASGSLA